jgi:hypothetical protein
MPLKPPGRRATGAVLMMLGVLTSCTHPMGSGGTDMVATTKKASCGLFEPIGWSRLDTPETIGAIKAHNAAYRAICGEQHL